MLSLRIMPLIEIAVLILVNTDLYGQCPTYCHSFYDVRASATVTYRINNRMGTQSITQAGWEGAIDAGASAWNSAGSFFYFFKGTDTPNNYNFTTADTVNCVGWDILDNPYLGETSHFYDSNNKIVETDTYVNQFYTWTLDPSTSSGYDAQSLFAHEFGHWISLNDETDVSCRDNTMSQPLSYNDIKFRDLTQDDKFGIQALYPVIIANQTLTTDRTVFEKWDGAITADRVTILQGVTIDVLSTCTLTVPAGSWLKVNPGASLFIESEATVNDNADIVIQNCGKVLNKTGITFSGSTACLANHGFYELSKGKTTSFTQGGFFTLDSTATIQVDSGATFLIDATANTAKTKLTPGGTFKFGQNAKLLCYDTLVAVGTAAKPIIFTSSKTSPAPGDWDAIRMFGGANSSNTLQYCNVSYATYGIFVNTGWNTTIDHCTIQNSSNYAVTVNNSITTVATVTVSNSTLTNDVGCVSVQNGDIHLVNTVCTPNNGWGAVLWAGGKLHMGNSSIINGTNYGIYATDVTAYVTLSPDGVSPGNNHIESNSSSQIFIIAGGAYLGERATTTTCVCDGGGQALPADGNKLDPKISLPQQTNPCPPPCYWQTSTWENAGYNYIKGPYYWVRTSSAIKAQLNYWGDCPYVNPANVPAAFYGSVDYSNYKTITSCSGTVMQPISEDHEAASFTSSNTARLGQYSASALSDIVIPDSVFIRWINQLRTQIVYHPDDLASADALKLLATLVGPSGRFQNVVAWDILLAALAVNTSSSDELKSVAQAFLLESILSKRDFDGLFQRVSSILAANPPDKYWMNAQTHVILAYLAKGDIPSAQTAYAGIQTRGSRINAAATAHLAELIALAQGGSYSGQPVGAPVGEEVVTDHSKVMSKVKPDAYRLEQNYPNPFNPTTRLNYAIPVDATVSLKVFNVLGQEVATVIDDFQTAGYKSVSFDASSLPSGLYFYRLQAGHFTDTKKMLLVK
ncbi:MAG: T9SS type A sorting domain-containing protein [Ignavibacteria bacterium]|nr:T9SS type A sorting domain-containing protein [Ignavibacteria bacterium]